MTKDYLALSLCVCVCMFTILPDSLLCVDVYIYLQKSVHRVPVGTNKHVHGMLYSKSNADIDDLQSIFADLRLILRLVTNQKLDDDRSMVMPSFRQNRFFFPSSVRMKSQGILWSELWLMSGTHHIRVYNQDASAHLCELLYPARK